MSKSILCVAATLLAATPALAAQRIVASAQGANVTIDAPATTSVGVNFATNEPITGVGLETLFTGVVVDNADGLFPWPSDIVVDVTSPDGQMLTWTDIGGDRSFVDFPLADTTAGFTAANGTGTYTFEFSDGFNSPGVSALQNPTYHLLADAPDVVTQLESDVSSGPLWDRPFFIDGISTLGPVVYNVVPFSPEVSGGYSFESTVDDGPGFTFLYKDAFDPDDPLANLLDTGLGNGNALNGTPFGESLIEALLLDDTDYFFVTSQWASTSGPQAYTTTVTGPGQIPEPSVGLLAVGSAIGLRRRRRMPTR